MRVAIYARVASAKQIQEFSLATQIQRMQEYAERNGLVITHMGVEDCGGIYREHPELAKQHHHKEK